MLDGAPAVAGVPAVGWHPAVAGILTIASVLLLPPYLLASFFLFIVRPCSCLSVAVDTAGVSAAVGFPIVLLFWLS
jgi:hypothetical protein